MSAIRVMIVVDETLIRHALSSFVESDPRTTVAGEAHDGPQAVSLCATSAPDVALIDITSRSGITDVAVTSGIVEACNSVRALILSSCSTVSHAVNVLRAGAVGYLDKDCSPEQLVQSIVDIGEGRICQSPAMGEALLRMVGPPRDDPDSLTTVTERERSILDLLALGRTNAEMAAELNLAETTIKANFTRLLTKWDARDRMQLLIRAVKERVVSLE